MKVSSGRGCVVVGIILILCASCATPDGRTSILPAAALEDDQLASVRASCARGDVDGDGEIECLYSLSPDASSHGTWQVQVWNSTGRVLKSVIAEARLLELADLDADGIPELLLERSQGSPASTSVPTPCPCAKPGDDLIAQLAIGPNTSDGRRVTVYSFLTAGERPLDTYGRLRSDGDD